MLGSLPLAAQDRGSQQIGVFAGGGPAITGGVRDRGFLLAGLRWNYQLTGDLASGSWAQGNLQYSVEAIPFYLQFQSDTVYGAGVTPFLLRYRFNANESVVPYIEMGAGMLFTADQVPEGTSRFNFTPQAGVGIQAGGPDRFWDFGVRYHHTSNAGIARRNPGINAVMLHLGLTWRR